mmetsp:Transcript_114844/g.371167  ORF Transcript_114844/g.371167 Transcript_114844/m.371167 type:complete len:219 (+) Transcript_114844:1676-2332(+)
MSMQKASKRSPSTILTSILLPEPWRARPGMSRRKSWSFSKPASLYCRALPPFRILKRLLIWDISRCRDWFRSSLKHCTKRNCVSDLRSALSLHQGEYSVESEGSPSSRPSEMLPSRMLLPRSASVGVLGPRTLAAMGTMYTVARSSAADTAEASAPEPAASPGAAASGNSAPGHDTNLALRFAFAVAAGPAGGGASSAGAAGTAAATRAASGSAPWPG